MVVFFFALLISLSLSRRHFSYHSLSDLHVSLLSDRAAFFISHCVRPGVQVKFEPLVSVLPYFCVCLKQVVILIVKRLDYIGQSIEQTNVHLFYLSLRLISQMMHIFLGRCNIKEEE